MELEQSLDQFKEQLNQFILQFVPNDWQGAVASVLPVHWQEWGLPVAGVPFFLFFLAEWAYQKSKNNDQNFSWKRALTNFNLGGSYLVFEMIIQALVVLPICMFLYQYRFFTIEVTWLSSLPIFIAVEFCYYWFHRGSHRITWFWSAHVVHHSDDKMNLSTAMRQSLLYSVVGWWLFFTPVMLLGVNPVWVFFFYVLNLYYQFFIHTETVGKFSPWIERTFNTPSNHRAHHGTNPEYIDKNYGGVLIIFDRMFGTYVEEDMENNPVRYGAIGEKTTDNLLQIIFSVFFRMWQKFFTTKGMGNRLKMLFQPPES